MKKNIKKDLNKLVGYIRKNQLSYSQLRELKNKLTSARVNCPNFISIIDKKMKLMTTGRYKDVSVSREKKIEILGVLGHLYDDIDQIYGKNADSLLPAVTNPYDKYGNKQQQEIDWELRKARIRSFVTDTIGGSSNLDYRCADLNK